MQTLIYITVYEIYRNEIFFRNTAKSYINIFQSFSKYILHHISNIKYILPLFLILYYCLHVAGRSYNHRSKLSFFLNNFGVMSLYLQNVLQNM